MNRVLIERSDILVKQKIAIYARKSVFREDSISIESQIEMCRYEARGEECVIYKDNGYSGKNTDRPDFQRMVRDIKSGLINKVIVYKLDRVSRSVLDFSGLMDLFQKYKVDFVSATEHFDTSSPMGRAMLNICVVFAQLERETIQQRVMDAYASRSKRGFYMGGKILYGYRKEPVYIDGVKTSMYAINGEEAEDVKLIYELYSKPSATLGDVLRELVARGINLNRRGHCWNTARLSETMRNPAYTRNDISVYEFYRQQGSNLINPPEQFDGNTSLYLFSGENTNRKTWDLKGQNVVIAPHTGFIEPDIWLTCRKKLLMNHQVKTCKPKNSFLSGKVKCGNCGYAIVVRYSARSKGHIRYFIDTGRTEHHCCAERLPTIHADEFEKVIVERIKEKLTSLTIKAKAVDRNDIFNEIARQENRVHEIDTEIDILVEKLMSEEIDKTAVKYINKKISQLDSEKLDVKTNIDDLKNDAYKKSDKDYKQLCNVTSKWDELTFDDKRSVVEVLIKKIMVYPDKIEIEWNI